jgi:hypothetical protein
VIGREGANKCNAWEVPLIKSNTLEVPAHGQVLSGFGQTYGDICSIFVIFVITMFLSLLVVKEYYAQTRKPSELKGKKKLGEKTWKRHLDAESKRVEAEKELRREWNSGRCPSKTSAVKHACYTLAKIIECPHISSRDFASNTLVEEVLESLGERTSVTTWTTTAFSCCTKVVSFATSARHAQAKTSSSSSATSSSAVTQPSFSPAAASTTSAASQPPLPSKGAGSSPAASSAPSQAPLSKMRVKRLPVCKRPAVSLALAVLVVASLVGSTLAYYSCTSASQCQYEGCNDVPCSSSSPNCVKAVGVPCTSLPCTWKADCDYRYCRHWTDTCPAPKPCPAGNWSGDGNNGAGDKACRPCEAGKYASSAGSSNCADCGAGKYAIAGSSNCADCGAGKYASIAGSSNCADCGAGTFSLAGAALCANCGAGKYASSAGSTACNGTLCAAGEHGPIGSTSSEAAACTNCEAGKYQATPAHESTVTLICGGTCSGGCSPLSGVTSGNISDGTGNYATNANCWWLLATSPGVEIQISFPSFDTTPCYDYMTIYQCSSASCSQQTTILRHSGSLDAVPCSGPCDAPAAGYCAPVVSASNVYTSTTGFLKVTFTVTSSNPRTGFTGTWSIPPGLASTACDNCVAALIQVILSLCVCVCVCIHAYIHTYV